METFMTNSVIQKDLEYIWNKLDSSRTDKKRSTSKNDSEVSLKRKLIII